MKNPKGFFKNILTRCFTKISKNSVSEDNPFLAFAPPGHFYSPLPDLNFIQKHRERIFKYKRELPGIEIDDALLCKNVKIFSQFYKDLPFTSKPNKNLRYYYENDFFSYGDAIILYSMIRYYNPKRIIEVGSGFSSALMLDINFLFFKNDISFIFIEPYPDRLYSLLKTEDYKHCHVIEDAVQNVPLEIFSSLSSNDILFIDSSHVVKVGSDVHFIITELLPILQEGVLIHFHDIGWPFEYPEEWFYMGRAWNEAYFLRAF